MFHDSKPGHLSRRSFLATAATAAMASGSTPRSALAQAGIGNINFRVIGTGEPTLLFVHGYACSLDDWDGQIKTLSSRLRCATLDLPGHGGSARPPAATIAAMAEAVNKVKEQIGSHRTILIGHSMGCRVVTEAFVQSRSDVAGLVFVDGSILAGDPETTLAKAKAAVARDGINAFTQRLFNDMFLESSDPKLRERLVARAQAVDAGFREELFFDLIRWDLSKAKEALKQITVPALVLQSTFINTELKRVALQAGMTTPWMDAVASLVPKGQAKVISGPGHFAMIEAAQAITDEIQKFAASSA
jgi:pimeloyl-ACP methyl ester carboxylesterase